MYKRSVHICVTAYYAKYYEDKFFIMYEFLSVFMKDKNKTCFFKCLTLCI